ncbi:MAG: hypothetical protein ACLQPD_10265 [Desulfomonilaceae bacterium]
MQYVLTNGNVKRKVRSGTSIHLRRSVHSPRVVPTTYKNHLSGMCGLQPHIPLFRLEGAQVPPFLKQTLTSAIEIPLKLKGIPRKRRKINYTRENEPKRDLTLCDDFVIERRHRYLVF